MVDRRAKSHIEFQVNFLDSVKVIVEALDLKNKELKKNKDYDMKTQLHNDTNLLRRWFDAQGNISL